MYEAGGAAVDQVRLLKYVRDLMQLIADIIERKAINAMAAAGGGYTVAATLATIEAWPPPNFGACVAEAPLTPHEMEWSRLITRVMTDLIVPSAHAEIDIDQELLKLGVGDIAMMVGVGVGFLATIVTTIYMMTSGAKTSGIFRAVWFGVAAGIGYAAGALLLDGLSTLKLYIEDMNILIAGFTKTDRKSVV